MFKSIYGELARKNVDIDDIKLAIMEGPIKFSDDELDYIFDYYINKIGLLKDNSTVAESNALLLVRNKKDNQN